MEIMAFAVSKSKSKDLFHIGIRISVGETENLFKVNVWDSIGEGNDFLKLDKTETLKAKRLDT